MRFGADTGVGQRGGKRRRGRPARENRAVRACLPLPRTLSAIPAKDLRCPRGSASAARSGCLFRHRRPGNGRSSGSLAARSRLLCRPCRTDGREPTVRSGSVQGGGKDGYPIRRGRAVASRSRPAPRSRLSHPARQAGHHGPRPGRQERRSDSFSGCGRPGGHHGPHAPLLAKNLPRRVWKRYPPQASCDTIPNSVQ